jgi:hypothetical protein
MSMVPYNFSFTDDLLALVRDGAVPQARIDEAVRRILRVKFELGLFENALPDAGMVQNIGAPAFQAVSRAAAEEAVTLLKNEGGLLPLAKTSRVLVTGPAAAYLPAQYGGWSYTWQGADTAVYPKGVKTLLAAVRDDVPDAVEAIEGPNEYDMRGEPDWPAKLRDYQRRLYMLAKADPRTARLPVLAPSLTSWQARAAVGDVGAWADAGNLHPYPAGAQPETSGLEREIEQARWLKPSGPLQVTETGYHGALAQAGGQPPVANAVAAAYLPRLLLDNFARGIQRSSTGDCSTSSTAPSRRRRRWSG